MVQGTEVLFILFHMPDPFIGIGGTQMAGAGQFTAVDDLVIPGQEFFGLFQPVRQLPGQFVIRWAPRFLDHISGKYAQIHIIPSVDFPDGFFLVGHLPVPEDRFLCFAAIVDIAAYHDPFIAPGLDRLFQGYQRQQAGCQGEQGCKAELLFVFHHRYSSSRMESIIAGSGKRERADRYMLKTIAVKAT